jgi:hypothetical protein
MKCAACGYEEGSGDKFRGILVFAMPGRDDGPTAMPLYICPACGTVRAE